PPQPPHASPLSLHDALPISNHRRLRRPAETWLTVTVASVPFPVLNMAAATSSLDTAVVSPPAAGVVTLLPVATPRSAITVSNTALTSSKRSPRSADRRVG